MHRVTFFEVQDFGVYAVATLTIRERFKQIVEERKELRPGIQKELAKALGCTPSKVSHLLAGRNAIKDVDIERACEYLGIPLSLFFFTSSREEADLVAAFLEAVKSKKAALEGQSHKRAS